MVRGKLEQKPSTHLQSKVHGLVGPDGRDGQDKVLLTVLEILADVRRLDDVEGVLVDGPDEVGGNIDRVLGQCFAVLLGTRGQVKRLWLVWVEKKLDAMDGRIAPGNLGTPLELGRVILFVKNERWDLGLAASLVA